MHIYIYIYINVEGNETSPIIRIRFLISRNTIHGSHSITNIVFPGYIYMYMCMYIYSYIYSYTHIGIREYIPNTYACV